MLSTNLYSTTHYTAHHCYPPPHTPATSPLTPIYFIGAPPISPTTAPPYPLHRVLKKLDPLPPPSPLPLVQSKLFFIPIFFYTSPLYPPPPPSYVICTYMDRCIIPPPPNLGNNVTYKGKVQQQQNCELAVHLGGGGGLLREHTHKKNCLNLGIAQKGGRVPPNQYSFHRCLFELNCSTLAWLFTQQTPRLVWPLGPYEDWPH